MITTPSSRGKNAALLIAGILMIATTLRVTFTGAAPLLDAIRADYGLSTAQTGLLTTLPLLAFALVSPLAAAVARRWGIERSLFAAMLLICVGIAIRSLPSSGFLFSGTAIIGCGIALGGTGLGNCGSIGTKWIWLARCVDGADGLPAAGADYLVAPMPPDCSCQPE